jgi:hypothetical protein
MSKGFIYTVLSLMGVIIEQAMSTGLLIVSEDFYLFGNLKLKIGN